MRIVTWAVRLILFVALLAFAAKNVEPVTLRFFFDTAYQVPLVLVAFAFFVAGAIVGLLAVAATLLRQRRQILRLRRELRRRGPGAADAGAPVAPVAPDA